MKTRFPQVSFVFIAVCLAIASISRAETEPDTTKWTTGSGNWNDATHWSAGLPNAMTGAEIQGNSAVWVPEGTYPVANLYVGLHYYDHARLEVDGGKIIIFQESLHAGELSGGEGEIILKSGAIHDYNECYIGGGNGVPGRSSRGALIIQGGSFLCRSLMLGSGWGAQSYLAVEGSHASAVHILQYLYLTALVGSDGTPGVCTLSFTIDEYGVTPITIQSTHDGLRIIKDTKGRCRLQIILSTIPPREDITLVSGHVPTIGTFDDLPEGSEVSAEYEHKMYRWQLTYKGGASGHDLVLKKKSEYAADAPVNHVRPMPEIPRPLWLDYPLYAPFVAKGEPAFPGAEGFGAFTPGGRGGKIIEVTNLNDSGPGSLRAAIETPGPRLVEFKVGGVIALKSTLRIREPFITIDGEDAPGPGIMLRDYGMEVWTHDVVLRYFRVRVGDDNIHLDDPKQKEAYYGGAGEHALYFIEGSKNCIADHLSLSWSTTKILSINKRSDLITIQWCILSEPLNFANHGLTTIIGQGRTTWHHNLIAHGQSRNPRFASTVDADFRNNVVYDWGDLAGCGEFDLVNFVGNYLKPGPSTPRDHRQFHDGGDVVMPKSLFLADNIMDGSPKINENNWLGVGFESNIAASAPFPAPPVTTESAQAAYEHVLKDAGATLPRRDAVDERIMNEVRTGSGHIIKWVKDAGGWPEFPSTAATDKIVK